MEAEVTKILDRYRRLCSMREYCSADVRTKLLKALDGDDKAVTEVMSVLVADRYVDDGRYAAAFARDKASISGWGEVKIRYMLSAKGIDRKTIDTALAEIDGYRAETRLVKLLENKYKSLREDPQCRLKLYRYALGRGYKYEEVAAVLNRLTAGND